MNMRDWLFRIGSTEVAFSSWFVLAVLLSLFLLKYLDRKNAKAKAEMDKGWMLLVVAHPDDESMFFLPTLRARNIRNRCSKTGPLHVLCLSNGGADGLGNERTLEMQNCCRAIFSVPNEQLMVLDDHRLQDGLTSHWDPSIAASYITSYVKRLQKKAGQQGTVVTFDNQGVSSHPNHIATHFAVSHVANELSSPDLVFYQLKSVSLLRKYLSIFDACLATLMEGSTNPNEGTPIFEAALSPLSNFRAMAAHHTQFVWYRKLFIVFSRYGFLNSLHRIK